MLMQPITIGKATFFYEQRSIVTRGGKQAIREADARKYEFIGVLFNNKILLL
ncbi:hypothetical protein SAMN05421882_100560 [Nitrosomonas communis]|uniref:Uncharacterized protein n=1 Tax=Nitrosomonas communis TaxID=44574 RepID=A0A1H2RSP3_9PROT|nr:hypothetical protein SAMN05421882_100560 [Nitrosomonas communis]